jgi:hypothetical protein
VVVVDDQPAASRPGFQILSENLGQRLDVLGWGGKSAKVLAKSRVTSLDESRARPSETQSERRDIRGRRARSC